MLQRKEEEKQAFAQRMAYAAELRQAGVSSEALLSKLYCRFLPDTPEEQGDWMARHVLEQIGQFDESRRVLADLDRRPEEEKRTLLGEELIRRMEGFVVTSQCRKLHSLNQAMEALDHLHQGLCTLEEAAAMTPAGYRGNTGEKGRNEALGAVLDHLLAPLARTAIQQEAARVAGQLGQNRTDDTLCRGVLTVALYTMMVQGAWPPHLAELPVSIEYVAAAVCCLFSPGEQDAAAVKRFLAAGFLAAGTATVMFIGSAVMIYAAYFLTAETAGRIIHIYLTDNGTEVVGHV